MSKVYFISESWLKDNSVINLNVEPQLINMSIQDAQLLYLKPALTTKLYNKMVTYIQSGSIPSPYKELMDDYILDVVVYYTLLETLPYVKYKIMNKSVVSQNSDNSTPITETEMVSFQNAFRNKAEVYCQRLVNHICANLSLYPEYQQNTDMDDLKPEPNQYYSGMQLDNDSDAVYKRIGYDRKGVDLWF